MKGNFMENEIDLSEDDVFLGLLDYGLFSEKVPICFTSVGLAEIVKNDADLTKIFYLTDSNMLKNALKKTYHDYIRYESVRDINVPRHFGIPHPESYAVQVLAIKKHWVEIKNHCLKPDIKVSRIHVRHTGRGCIFAMNYKGPERFQMEENEIHWMSGATFIVKTDISKCFNSIYTHSIPWALNGHNEAKKDTNLLSLSGNLLDKCTQNIRDRQTNGLLIGPHSSNIIAEIVLTKVDSQLLEKGYKKLKRYIDDYEFYAESYDEAESFLHDLSLFLREFELSINEKKTSILPLPRPRKENWIRELNRYQFPANDKIKFVIVRSFLDLTLELSKLAGTSAPLNYAIKMMPKFTDERAKRLYVQEIMNLTLMYPYLTPFLDNYVFEKFQYNTINEHISNFCEKLIKLGIKKLYPDAIAYAIYYAMKYCHEVPVKEEQIKEILKINDCLVTVLLFEYANKYNLKEIKSIIENYSNELKFGDKREMDRQWLLIYQTWTEADLNNKGQTFLAKLKNLSFNFISKNFDSKIVTKTESENYEDSL